MSVETRRLAPSWRSSLERVTHRLGVATLAGALVGLIVGGVGGRLAMMLVAVRNPYATGLVSDDGFRIGQFTLAGTVSLLAFATLVGVLGGGIYLVLRDLLIGPRWFQICSIAGGAGAVVGSELVHTDGVDFTLLLPVWLTVSLFVIIPGAYGALLTVLADRWLAASDRPSRPRRVLFTASLLLWLPLAPILAVGALGWLAAEVLRRYIRRDILASSPALAWALRLGLGALFLVSLANLARDVAHLT
jgi:hypothetical protein